GSAVVRRRRRCRATARRGRPGRSSRVPLLRGRLPACGAGLRALPVRVLAELSASRRGRPARGHGGSMTTAGEDAVPRLQHDRQQAIYMLALRQGSVDVADLARRYSVTTETIRRDLSDMQERQLLRRVHGGAVPVERMNHEPMVDARDMVNAEEKLRIATKAVDEVPERGS